MNGQTAYEFGDFLFVPSERLLLRNGEAVALSSKVFDTLAVLVENSGRVVQKDDLMKRVWPDAIVEESGLTRNISILRKSLGEDSAGQPFIETVPKVGYRFLAKVRQSPFNSDDIIIERRVVSHTVTEEDLTDKNISSTDDGRLIRAPARPARVIIWAVALSLLSVIAAAYFLIFRTETKGADASVRSIAILPFKVLGSDADKYLGIGMADVLITRLSAAGDIMTRPTSAILRYDEQDTTNAGRDLKVDATLEGSIHKVGDRLRVTVRLISTKNGATIWADQFDEKLTDLLAVQDSICEQVAGALAMKLAGESRFAKSRTEDMAAYHLYLKGRYFWNRRTREGYKKAIEYFNQAIEKDVAYAPAYAGLADCYVLGGDARSSEEAFSKAKAAAIKALEIDDALAEAHASLALVRMAYDWDFASAESEFKRAIALNPNYATSHQWYADCLILTGRTEQAIASLRRAQELDPLSLIISRDAGRLFYFARRYDEAIEECRKALELEPDFYPLHVTLGDASVQKKEFDAAIGHYQKVINLSGGRSLMKPSLAYTYAVAGKKEEARRLIGELTEISVERPPRPFDLAVVYAGLGEKDEAFRQLEKAYKERAYRLIYLIVEPVFDPLRSDPRFAKLIERINPAL